MLFFPHSSHPSTLIPNLTGLFSFRQWIKGFDFRFGTLAKIPFGGGKPLWDWKKREGVKSWIRKTPGLSQLIPIFLPLPLSSHPILPLFLTLSLFLLPKIKYFRSSLFWGTVREILNPSQKLTFTFSLCVNALSSSPLQSPIQIFFPLMFSYLHFPLPPSPSLSFPFILSFSLSFPPFYVFFRFSSLFLLWFLFLYYLIMSLSISFSSLYSPPISSSSPSFSSPSFYSPTLLYLWTHFLLRVSVYPHCYSSPIYM